MPMATPIASPMAAGARRGAVVADAATAVAAIRNGDTVFVASAAATPTVLIEALYRRASSLSGVTLLHFITDGAVPPAHADDAAGAFAHRAFFVDREMRAQLDRGAAIDYVPLSIAQVPQLVRAGRLTVDVALIQTTRPDRDGVLRMGVGVDLAECMVERARVVIAEANARMPTGLGDNQFASHRVDYLVPTDRPLPTYLHQPVPEISRQVAAYLGSLIADGSTLQVGVGQIPNEALRFLSTRNDLGIHSDVITDTVLDLIDAGNANGLAKSRDRGVAVASYCFGSQRLYDRLDRNPAFAFRAIDRICAPDVIAAQHRMVSLSQVFSIDLTGQACSDQFDGRLYGGVCAQPDLLRATAAAPGGKPIVCLASTTADGATSRIRPVLAAGDGATIPRADVHIVVTEYGVADLFARSIPERALALIELAHPSFRPWLLDEAKRLGYLPAAQTLATTGAYPVAEERSVVLRDGATLGARPAKASDAPRVRALFHAMSDDDVYTRFFRRLSCLSFADTQRLCNVDYEEEVAFIVTVGDDDAGPLVAAASYYKMPNADRAEVAYMIHPDWQGRGLGGFLQALLLDYGRRRGVIHFVAEVLRTNGRMSKLARAACRDVRVEADGDVLTITMTP